MRGGAGAFGRGLCVTAARGAGTMLRGALRPTYQRLRRAAAPLPVLLRRPLCDSSGSGGGPVVVSRDLLAARRAPRDAAASPPAAAPADASAAPPAALFDELDEIPGTAPPLRTQGTDATPVADAAGRGLVGRILQEGAGAAKLDAAPDSEPEWSLALSSSDRVAALEQIREELDFDTLFDEDVKEVAKLTAHELAELEKTRFGHAVGDTPDWGMPGPAPFTGPCAAAAPVMRRETACCARAQSTAVC